MKIYISSTIQRDLFLSLQAEKPGVFQRISINEIKSKIQLSLNTDGTRRRDEECECFLVTEGEISFLALKEKCNNLIVLGDKIPGDPLVGITLSTSNQSWQIVRVLDSLEERWGQENLGPKA